MNFLLAFVLGILYYSPASVNAAFEEVFIDVREDIPDNGKWTTDCTSGYATIPSGLTSCYSGVDFPPEDLDGETGFWTKCSDRCRITYAVQPEDVSFSARLYQLGTWSQVSFDGITWKYIIGEGWTNYDQSLEDGSTHTISIQMDYVSNTMFTVLDKIALNKELETPTTTTETPTETPTTETPTTETPTTETPTTETPTTETPTTETPTTETPTTETPTTETPTTETPTTETPTTETPTTETPTTETPTTETPKTETPTTETPTTETPTTETPTTETPTTETHTTETQTASTKSTTEYTSNVPTTTLGPYPPIMSTETSNDDDFFDSIWFIFLMAFVGSLLFALSLACCLRIVCVKRTLASTATRSDSQDRATRANRAPPFENKQEPYGFLESYIVITPQQNDVSRVQPQNPAFAANFSLAQTPTPDPLNPYSPRAIFRNSTPYMMFDNELDNGYESVLINQRNDNDGSAPAPRDHSSSPTKFVRVLPRQPPPPTKVLRTTTPPGVVGPPPPPPHLEPYYAQSQKTHPGPSRPPWVAR